MKYKVYVDWLTQWGKDYLSHLKQIFQGKLTAGQGVTIDENNVISASSTGDEYMLKENPVGSGSLSMNRKEETTVGDYSVTLGYNCTAVSQYDHAEGHLTTADTSETLWHIGAHAEGSRSAATGDASHSEGNQTTASGQSAHSEGWATVASGLYAHAEGARSTATGDYSHAEGNNTSTAGFQGAHTEGNLSIASRDYQHVGGVFNSDNSDALMIIGNGEDNVNRSNAFEVLADGRATVGADPVDNMDITTKQYVDGYFEFLDNYSEEEF